MSNVLLCGYMGSGKSAVGARVASYLRRTFFDLDQLIEQREELAVKDIFATKGEIYFRKVEHLVLTELLSKHSDAIVALGGGTPCYYNNHLLLQRDDVESFYLLTSVDTLTDRLAEGNQRPLVQKMDRDGLNDFIRKHLFDRSFYYNQAKHIIRCDGKSVDEIALEICSYFK